MDLESAREYGSVVASGVAVISTFYFWLIRANAERGSLSAHPMRPVVGSLLMAMEDVTTYRRIAPENGEIILKYWLHIAVVNNSTLPNAMLGARVWIKFADVGWQEMDVHNEMPEEDLFPVNIDPMTTLGVKLALATKRDGELSGGFRERAAAAGDVLGESVPIRIELQALREQSFVCEFLDPGTGLERTETPQRMAA